MLVDIRLSPIGMHTHAVSDGWTTLRRETGRLVEAEHVLHEDLVPA